MIKKLNKCGNCEVGVSYVKDVHTGSSSLINHSSLWSWCLLQTLRAVHTWHLPHLCNTSPQSLEELSAGVSLHRFVGGFFAQLEVAPLCGLWSKTCRCFLIYSLNFSQFQVEQSKQWRIPLTDTRQEYKWIGSCLGNQRLECLLPTTGVHTGSLRAPLCCRRLVARLTL